jgi:hypothetical protein
MTNRTLSYDSDSQLHTTNYGTGGDTLTAPGGSTAARTAAPR